MCQDQAPDIQYQVRLQIWNQSSYQLIDRVATLIGWHAHTQVRNTVYYQVYDQATNQVGHQIKENVKI